MGRLTTHVLDTHGGTPAASIRIQLHRVTDAGEKLLTEQITGPDGRCPQPLCEDASFTLGTYVLTFHVADYFRSRGVALPDPPFINDARVHFGIASPQAHYHVPLLITPWSYSVYRGG
jgi:5-hydroxyisourate hydrolase